jgi:hypothetical protein
MLLILAQIYPIIAQEVHLANYVLQVPMQHLVLQQVPPWQLQHVLVNAMLVTIAQILEAGAARKIHAVA